MLLIDGKVRMISDGVRTRIQPGPGASGGGRAGAAAHSAVSILGGSMMLTSSLTGITSDSWRLMVPPPLSPDGEETDRKHPAPEDFTNH